MAEKNAFYGLNLNFPFPTGGITATSGAVTVTAGTGGLTACNGGYYANLTAGAKTPVYVDNNGKTLSSQGIAAPVLLSGSYPALVNGSTTTVTYGQGAIVVFALANLATVGGVANTPVAWNQSGTIGLVAVVGPVANIDPNGALLGAENSVGQNGGSGALLFPDLPDLLTPVGYFTVKNPAGSSTATFTFGTTNWNATSIVTTAYNVVSYPLRPLTGF